MLFSVLGKLGPWHIELNLGDNGTTNHHHHQRQCHQLQTALARVLDELERNQEQGKSSGYNFQDDGHISLGPVVYF